MKTRKITGALVALSLMLGLAACSGQSSETQQVSAAETEAAATEALSKEAEVQTEEQGSSGSSDDVKVYMIGGMPGGPAWGPASIGFETACEELGWEGTYLAPTQAANQTEIYELMITASTNGADAIIVLAIDDDILGDLVDELKADGIILIGANAGLDSFDAVVGVDSAEQARLFAEAVLETVPEDEHIYSVAMTTTLNTTTEEWNAVYEQALIDARGAENCTFYDTLECQSSTQTAYENFSAFKLANPDCNVFVSLNSYAGLGVNSYIEENGLQDELYAFGIDDSEEILQAVKDGNLVGTLSQGFYNIGYQGVYVAKQEMDGEDHEWQISSNPEMVWQDMADDWAAKLGYTLK